MNTSFFPVITTIIPTFRRPKLLKRAIRSVLNQTYPHFKLCIYDNASGDETSSVVKSFMQKDSRIHYHCHPENIGAGKNFLYGLNEVKTDCFNFLSDDDIVLPHFYEMAVNAFEKEPGCSCFVGATIRADPDGRFMEVPVSQWKNGVYNPPDGFIEMLREGRHPEWTAIIFKTAVLKDNIMDLEVSTKSDLDFQLKIAARNPIMVYPKPCAIFSFHPIVKSPRFSLSTEIPGMFKLIQNIYNINQISDDVKNKARDLVMIQMQTITFRLGIRGALTGFREETIYAHSIFIKFFRKPFQTKLLNILANDTLLSRLSCILLSLLWSVRRIYIKKIPTKWEKKYKGIKEYFNEISGD